MFFLKSTPTICNMQETHNSVAERNAKAIRKEKNRQFLSLSETTIADSGTGLGHTPSPIQNMRNSWLGHVEVTSIL